MFSMLNSIQSKYHSLGYSDLVEDNRGITFKDDMFSDELCIPARGTLHVNNDIRDFVASSINSKTDKTIDFCVDKCRLSYIKEAIKSAKLQPKIKKRNDFSANGRTHSTAPNKESLPQIVEGDKYVQKKVSKNAINKLKIRVLRTNTTKPMFEIVKHHAKKPKRVLSKKTNTARVISRLKRRSIKNLLKPCKVRTNKTYESPVKAKIEFDRKIDNWAAVNKINDWFTNYIPLRNPYYPQIDDEIIVFVAAYEQFVETIHSFFPNVIIEKEIPSPVKTFFQFQGVVRHIEFVQREHNSNYYFLRITVEIVKRKKFVQLWWSNRPISDFIVLKCDYKFGDFLVGDRFRMLSNQLWWRGTITKFAPKFPKLETSFRCFEVRYDNGETGELSPWHLHELGDDKSIKKSGTPLCTHELPMLLYKPKQDEWPSCGREYECFRIFNGLKSLLATNVGKIFQELRIRRYRVTTIHGIDLHTIIYRLNHLYYRRKQAIEFDCEHLHQSLMSFVESDLTEMADSYFKKIMLFIRDENCFSIQYIFLNVHPPVDIY